MTGAWNGDSRGDSQGRRFVAARLAELALDRRDVGLTRVDASLELAATAHDGDDVSERRVHGDQLGPDLLERAIVSLEMGFDTVEPARQSLIEPIDPSRQSFVES